MHRCIMKFAFDVPQRLVYACYGTHKNGASSIESTAVHGLPVFFDLQWVLTHQVVGQCVYCCGHTVGAFLNHRFTPSEKALVSVNF